MTNKDDIKDLFSKGLQDHQISVDPALWSSISSSIGSGSATTGLGLLSKILIGTAASSIAAVSIYLVVEATSAPEIPKIPVQIKTPILEQNTNSNPIERSGEQTPSPIQTPPRANTAPSGDTPTLTNHQTSSSTLTQTALTQVVSEHYEQNLPILSESFQISGYPVPPAVPPVINSNTSGLASQAYANALNAAAQTIPSTQRIFLPNVFTPNGDGHNETLQIDWKEADIQDFSIVVLDLRNNVVFKNDKPDFAWDGSDLSGEKLAPGSYIYFVTALLNGQKWQQSSNLQIQY